MLEAALDVLLGHGTRFKVVKSTELLRALNAGQFGVPQIGKFITVYPNDGAVAVAVVVRLGRSDERPARAEGADR